MSFETMNSHTFEIDTDTTGSNPDLEIIAKGIMNVDFPTNEELDQTRYLDGNGFGETDVIGSQLILVFTGHRNYADAAQNFIFGKLLTIGKNRRVPFKWTEPDGGIFEGEVTIANIKTPSGDAGAKGEISFEVHFNGLPQYTAPSGDATPPGVTVSPLDAATGVAVSTNIVWTFDEPIQSSTVTSANFFIMDTTGAEVAGALSINGAKTIVTFNPTSDLAAATAYTAVATKNVKDEAGNALAANSVTNFTTA